MTAIKSPHARPREEYELAVAVAAIYRSMAHGMESEADDLELTARRHVAENRPVNARKVRYQANQVRRSVRLAKRAAIAEETHPDSPERPCGICGGDSICVS